MESRLPQLLQGTRSKKAIVPSTHNYNNKKRRDERDKKRENVVSESQEGIVPSASVPFLFLHLLLGAW